VDLHGFIEERKPAWRRLETLLDEVERRRFRLRPEEARELGALYRRASADLCRAQARTANAELLRYLNDLVARAYGQIYSGRRFRLSETLEFFSHGFPALVRARWRAVAASAAILFLGIAFGFAAAWVDEDARHFLLPEQFRDVARSIESAPQKTSGQVVPVGEAAVMSSAIMSNNIRVSFMAFAFGITAGVGTAAVLFTNGLMLGVLAAYFQRAGPAYALDFWALILPHGVIELTAIALAGAAGLLLGAAILAPGGLTRRQALRRRGAEAGRIAIGTVPMLVVAGLIEGFVTPQSFLDPAAKLGFAAVTAVALALYFAPRERLWKLILGR
jgi:uncharacterized membrane protein SpoIIM required for sporulation